MKRLLSIFSLLMLFVWHAKAQDVASVTWPLVSTTQGTASLSGQLESDAFSYPGLALSASPYGGPSSSITIGLEDGQNTNWANSEYPDKYIEFSITPKAGNKLHATNISALVCGKGGGNMRANFYYSTDPTFTEKTQINYRVGQDLTRDNVAGLEEMTVEIDETIEAGQRVYFRIYPFYKSVTSGKYICLKDVTISGTTEATEIEASVTWPFLTNTEPVISGSLLSDNMGFSSGMQVYGYTTGAPTYEGETLVGGTVGPPSSTSCAWTASEVPQEDMYVQYQIAPKAGATLTVKNVSMLISAFSTNQMKAVVYYSKSADFSDKTLLKDNTVLNVDALSLWEFPINEVIASGETFYVRIYPYMPINATWKLVYLRNVTISGTMIGATADPAEVSTNTSVTYISTTTALSGGTISNDGGAAVTARGMVWGTSANPTIEGGQFSTDGDGAGIFESKLTGLTAGTKYYARAYATNKAGTAYGEDISFTTLAELVAPTVQTLSTSSVRNVSMVVTGKVTAWGGTEVTERGVVWGTSTNPTTNKVESGSDLGNFNAYIDGLTPETKYYVRAYAVNSTGIAYGNEVEVTTKATDPDVTKIISQDGTGDYTTVQAAFDAVPSSYTGRWIIRIKPGTYYERPTLLSGKVNVYLIGEDAASTIITHDTYAGQDNGSGGTWGTSNSQTMAIMADDFLAANITIANTFVNSKENTAINSGTQAVALKTQADRQSFYNCRITGYQDTYLGNSIGRAYFKECYIEGNVDFIFGRQTVVFDECTTYVNRTGSVLTAPSTEKTTKFGMVFLDCNLTAPSTSYIDFNGDTFKEFYYGRPWQQQPRSAFIRCDVPATLNEKGWTTMNGGLSPVFVEYGCTGEGATAERLTKRGNEGIVISAEEAAVYTVENIFKKDTDPSFASDWMPKAAPDQDLITSIGSSVVYDKMSSYSSPNPFTDSFSINYTLENESNVVINLYDISGKLLKKVENSTQSAGSYSVSVNGSALSAGVYLYTIQTSSGSETQKIIKK